MPDEQAPASFSKAKREQKVQKQARQLERYARALDLVLEDHEPFWRSYIAYYRLRHGCDPDTDDVPLDYLDVTIPEEPEE